jgi:hypothetical protein
MRQIVWNVFLLNHTLTYRLALEYRAELKLTHLLTAVMDVRRPLADLDHINYGIVLKGLVIRLLLEDARGPVVDSSDAPRGPPTVAHVGTTRMGTRLRTPRPELGHDGHFVVDVLVVSDPGLGQSKVE